MGISYDFVELFTGAFLPLSDADQAAFVASLSADAQAQFSAWGDKARSIHRRNSHKSPPGPRNL